MSDKQGAFILRIAPGGEDMVGAALARDEILIGWPHAKGLTANATEWAPFRQTVSDAYYPNEPNQRKAGGAAGQLWRFIRQMQVGDLVVVPHPGVFYVAQVTSEAQKGSSEHDFYRREVKWLNNKQPIPRKFARAALQSRMKVYNSCADASDLVDAIAECLQLAGEDKQPEFHSDLHSRLVGQTIDEIRGGRMDSYGFEALIRSLMLSMGARQCSIVARSKDFGADLVATFLLAGVFELRIAIQAKHYYDARRPMGAGVVGEVIRGIERENANLGMIITAGSISESASAAAQAYFDEKGIKIELVDGEQFAALIVERGVGAYHAAPGGHS